ncbi:hypothetical protein SAMN05444487_11834 [Marininema mesophilum]|uniref:Uncharacterized protein n=1 Tax=Marininema mesophilum TaxID=1048340 RepID=A0A1H3BW72_9BACL|nr:hypothetical protein [Marininema mesophilum]SDX45429.1 hypothetical protein SAMN05444487_11834 [Marininema mesophilum]
MQKLRRVLPFAAAFALVATVSTSAAFASDGNDAVKADKSLPTKHAVKAPSNSTPAKPISKAVAIAKDKNGNVTIKKSDKNPTGTTLKPAKPGSKWTATKNFQLDGKKWTATKDFQLDGKKWTATKDFQLDGKKWTATKDFQLDGKKWTATKDFQLDGKKWTAVKK